MHSITPYLWLSLGSLLASHAIAGPQDWSFIQAVGGMQIGTPYQEYGDWYLPVMADLSGQQRISTAPTAHHGTIRCKEVLVDVAAERIYLTVSTDTLSAGASHPQDGARCPPARLDEIAPGKYGVYYQYNDKEPHRLGEITITPDPGLFSRFSAFFAQIY